MDISFTFNASAIAWRGDVCLAIPVAERWRAGFLANKENACGDWPQPQCKRLDDFEADGMSGAWLALILAVVAPLFAFLGVVATLLFGPRIQWAVGTKRELR